MDMEQNCFARNWFHSNANAITKRKGIVNRCNTNKKGLRNLNTQSFERKEKENYVNQFWWNECLSRLSVRKWMKNKKCIEMSANSIKKINGEKESGLFLLLYKILYAKFLSKETRSNKSNINIFSSNFSVIVNPSLVCWWHCISSRSAKHRVHLQLYIADAHFSRGFPAFAPLCKCFRTNFTHICTRPIQIGWAKMLVCAKKCASDINQYFLSIGTNCGRNFHSICSRLFDCSR